MQCHPFFAVDVFKEAQREKKKECAESGNFWAKEPVPLLWEGCPTCTGGRGTQNMGTGLELLPQLLSLLELGEKMNQEEDLACEGIQHLPEGEQEEFKSAFCI